MRLFKLALAGVVSICVVVWAMSLLFPSFVKVSRAVEVRAPKAELLSRLVDVSHWNEWNELTRGSNLTHVAFNANTFRSDQLQLRIVSVNGDSIRIVWTQKSGKQIPGGFNLYSSPGDLSTTVQWYFDFNLRWYPWEKIGSIIFDKELGPVMESSLDNLGILAMRKQ